MVGSRGCEGGLGDVGLRLGRWGASVLSCVKIASSQVLSSILHAQFSTLTA